MSIDRFIRRQMLHVLTPDRDLYFPYGRMKFIREMLRWHGEVMKQERYQMSDIRCSFTVILQSYKRPWNIEPMVRMFLRFPNVERVIVSNNNPETDVRCQISDPRLEIINQTVRYPASKFAMLALTEAEKGSEYFLSIDDDLLLFPEQIATLIKAMSDAPEIPHGLVGQILTDDGQVLAHHLTGESAIDVLNRAYIFTADHIRRYAEILDGLGYKTDEEKAQLPFGSDIVLSSCGTHKPQIHDVGLLLSCPTAAKKGIARFKDTGFSAFRQELWKKIRAL